MRRYRLPANSVACGITLLSLSLLAATPAVAPVAAPAPTAQAAHEQASLPVAPASFNEEVGKVLTADQTNKLKDLGGKPFTFAAPGGGL